MERAEERQIEWNLRCQYTDTEPVKVALLVVRLLCSLYEEKPEDGESDSTRSQLQDRAGRIERRDRLPLHRKQSCRLNPDAGCDDMGDEHRDAGDDFKRCAGKPGALFRH